MTGSPEQYVPQELLFDQGKTVTLVTGGAPSQDGFYTSSQIVREWYILIQPTVNTLAKLQAVGVLWSVFATLECGYVSTSGVRINRPLTIETPFDVSVAGTCIPVHGSFIRLKFERQVPKVAPQVDVELTVFGLPGVPRPWSYPYFLIVVPPVGTVGVPTLAWGFSISGQIDVGDTIDQFAPDGTGVQVGVPITQNYANFIQPIMPQTSVLQVNSAVAKRLLINFYFRM